MLWAGRGLTFPIWFGFSSRISSSQIQPTVSCQRLRISFAFWHFYRRSHMSFPFFYVDNIFNEVPFPSLCFALLWLFLFAAARSVKLK